MSSLPHKIRSAISFVVWIAKQTREKGIKNAFRYVKFQLGEEWREWRLGVRTTGFIPWQDIGNNSDCHPYEPISYEILDNVFRDLKIDSGKDVLLDYGCGKGRVNVVASSYPFRRVIGVELSSELSEIARSNVERVRKFQKSGEVEIITADASSYTVPREVNVILLFNPFGGRILSEVQNRIQESLAAEPRELSLIYAYPDSEEDKFADCQWLTYQNEISAGFWEGVRCTIYKHHPKVTCLP